MTWNVLKVTLNWIKYNHDPIQEIVQSLSSLVVLVSFTLGRIFYNYSNIILINTTHCHGTLGIAYTTTVANGVCHGKRSVNLYFFCLWKSAKLPNQYEKNFSFPIRPIYSICLVIRSLESTCMYVYYNITIHILMHFGPHFLVSHTSNLELDEGQQNRSKYPKRLSGRYSNILITY